MQCDLCSHLKPTVGPEAQPMPRPFLNTETGHYLKPEETISQNRPPDDYQLHAQLKLLYKTGQISGNSVGKIQDFANKYFVDRELIISQLNHWTDLDIKKEARKRNRGVQFRKIAKRRRTAVKEKENRVDDDDETDDDGSEMGDDADGNENERRVMMRMKKKMMKKKKVRMRY